MHATRFGNQCGKGFPRPCGTAWTGTGRRADCWSCKAASRSAGCSGAARCGTDCAWVSRCAAVALVTSRTGDRGTRRSIRGAPKVSSVSGAWRRRLSQGSLFATAAQGPSPGASGGARTDTSFPEWRSRIVPGAIWQTASSEQAEGERACPCAETLAAAAPRGPPRPPSEGDPGQTAQDPPAPAPHIAGPVEVLRPLRRIADKATAVRRLPRMTDQLDRRKDDVAHVMPPSMVMPLMGASHRLIMLGVWHRHDNAGRRPDRHPPNKTPRPHGRGRSANRSSPRRQDAFWNSCRTSP